jgi:hypothetical protein
VDVHVNNAGTYPEGALLALDTEKLVAFRINFLGAAISSVAGPHVHPWTASSH